MKLKRNIRNALRRFFFMLFPELKRIINKKKLIICNSNISVKSKINGPCSITKVILGDYSYIAQNSNIQLTQIGKFCSIGPNFFCGWGIHPITGISTSPVLYSKHKQAGYSFSKDNKIIEQKEIKIGNDVFIGMNVTVLDGVNIGDGAIIGAGAVVVNDVEPYSIVGGVPAKILKFRFDYDKRKELNKIKWWDLGIDDYEFLSDHFFDIELILKKYGNDK